jgi:hypothetical protein
MQTELSTTRYGLKLVIALGFISTGCASSPDPSQTGGDVARRASRLSAAACSGYHAISREPRNSRCRSIPGKNGRWSGRRVAQLGEAAYCSYRWVANTSTDGGSSRAPEQSRSTLAPASARSAPTTLRPPTGNVPLLATRLKATPARSTKTAPSSQTRPAATFSAKPDNGPTPDHRVLEKLKHVQIDCPVTASLAPVGPNHPAWLDERLATHRAQTGWVEKLPRAQITTRVAVVDSAAHPYGSSNGDTYGHGRTVGRVIADLGCPRDGASACPIEVVNHLALPLRKPGVPDYTNGGYYGTRGQLTAALTEAVEAWRAARRRGGAQRLVLNLSVGWSGRHGGAIQGDYRETDIASQAVYAAVSRASCEGALVIAAVGNRTAPGDSGPMYPAGWESVAAPDEKLCAAYGWRDEGKYPAFGTETYRPLVYAVGGVDARDEPLVNTRPGSQPRLVGHALAVVATDPARGGWTDTLTGTSIACAVASGVAAASWSFQPQRSAHAVMDSVYHSAIAISPTSGAVTEHCLGAGPACSTYAIRRISACEALAKAIETTPADLGCKTVPAQAGKAAAPGAPDTSAYTALPPTGPACGSDTCGHTGLVSKSEKPWVGPQPGYPSCANCYLLRNWQYLFVGLEPGATTTLKSVMIQPVSPTSAPVYELLPGVANYPQYFAARVPGSSSAYMANLITIHTAGFTSVEVTQQEPIPVY